MHISLKQLSALGGVAALIGGLLRVASSFIEYQPDLIWLEVLYAFIDISLLFALIAFYLSYAAQIGMTGLIGFVSAVTGLSSIVGPDATAFGLNFYQLGATILLCGLLLLSISIRQIVALKWVSRLWCLSFLLALLANYLAHPVFTISAGISFALAFILCGVRLISNSQE